MIKAVFKNGETLLWQHTFNKLHFQKQTKVKEKPIQSSLFTLASVNTFDIGTDKPRGSGNFCEHFNDLIVYTSGVDIIAVC